MNRDQSRIRVQAVPWCVRRFALIICILLVPVLPAQAGPNEWIAPWESTIVLVGYTYPKHATLGTTPEKFALDFARDGGCDLFAPCNGKMIMYQAGNSAITSARMTDYGNYLMFKPDDYDAQIIMAHMDSLSPALVSRFEKGIFTIKQGEYVGYMGNTGNSTGTHLHFEITVPRGDITHVFGYDVLHIMRMGIHGGFSSRAQAGD